MDYRARQGCEEEEKLWDRETKPLALHDMATGDMISPHRWNPTAEKKAEEVYGQWARERLSREGQAFSTISLVKEDRG